jgi:hypothetical protein
MLNASASGFLAWPADPVLTGERLIMTFRLPDYGIWIDAEGVVARVVHGRRSGEWHRALGIDFTRIRDFSRCMLERTLRRVPYAPPTPRSPVPRVAATLQRLARSSTFHAG